MNASRRCFTAALLLVCLGGCGHKQTPTEPPGPSGSPPQITCGADITVSTVGGTKAVSFALPTTTDGTAPVSVTCTPASGGQFPLGTTPVLCVATDAAARQAVCTINITVKGVQFGAKVFSAVGDSLTEGENGLPAGVYVPAVTDVPNSYPTKLQALLDASFPNQGMTVVNHGVGGESTAGTLSYLQGHLDPINHPVALSADHPDAVLVLSGYNDITFPCRVGYTDNALCDAAVDGLEANLHEIIRAAKGYPGVRYVFVSTLTPGRLSGGRAIDPDRVVDANTHIRTAVAAEGATLVDTYPLFLGHENEYVSVDGLHLNPAGYQVMAQAFFDKILATVPQTNPQSFNFRRR